MPDVSDKPRHLFLPLRQLADNTYYLLSPIPFPSGLKRCLNSFVRLAVHTRCVIDVAHPDALLSSISFASVCYFNLRLDFSYKWIPPVLKYSLSQFCSMHSPLRQLADNTPFFLSLMSCSPSSPHLRSRALLLVLGSTHSLMPCLQYVPVFPFLSLAHALLPFLSSSSLPILPGA
jgi:hypothetical protein